MKFVLINYPKCSTCQKAKRYLEHLNIDFMDRDIVNDTPTVDELRIWKQNSGFELKKFFNTSGNLYKEMKLKDKLKDMDEEELLVLLSKHGMLIKRPILVCDNGTICVGFNEENYKKLCN